MTFTQYGLTHFQVQYWNGSTWLDVPGGNISGSYAALLNAVAKVMAEYARRRPVPQSGGAVSRYSSSRRRSPSR